MLGRTAGGLLRFLSAWEFESRVFPEIPKFGGFASPARYFYFTLSDFSNMRLLFLITLIFLLCVQKSRTSVRDFCLHLFCQCKLVDSKGIEPSTSALRTRRSPEWFIKQCEHLTKSSAFHQKYGYATIFNHSIFTWHIFIVSSAAWWLSWVTPAQHDLITRIGVSGSAALISSALDTTQISVHNPISVISSSSS